MNIMNTTSIADALFTKTQQRVLATLFGKPDQSFYLNEIVRLANIGKGTVKRELERMTAAGLLTIKRIGNQNHYQANPDSPIYSELLGITRKTFGIADVIKTALLPLDAQIEQAFIYGSVAKQQDTASSDIDLLLVSDALTYADAMAALHPLMERLGREINPTLYTRAELRKRIAEGNSFVTRVLAQPRLWLIGSDDALAA